MQVCSRVIEIKREVKPSELCVAKKRLNPHKHSTSSTGKRMKVTSVDDEVDDTDIHGTEVFTYVQVAKQVRSSTKKWMKKQDDVFWHNLREDEHNSLCVKPNERSSGSFSVSIRCSYGMWKNYYVAAKNETTYVVSNCYRHAHKIMYYQNRVC